MQAPQAIGHRLRVAAQGNEARDDTGSELSLRLDLSPVGREPRYNVLAERLPNER